MKRIARTVALVAIAFVAGAVYYVIRRPPPPPDAGIPLALAEERAARVSALAYDVSLNIPLQKSEPVRGTIAASFDLSDHSRPLAFDFAQPSDRLVSVEANGTAVDATIEQGHIVIPRSRLVAGRNAITFTFTAGDEALNRQDDFLYSLFVPARASLTLPCFDQPDLKARWRLTLNLPAEWSAISNGKATGRVAKGDRVSVIFDETQPISTYLFAFAAGRFNIELGERNGRQMRMFHRETDEAKVARNRDAIFDQHARAIEWLERYTAVAYPFGKFDFVLIPSFQFGGMEHPGSIYYNASSLLLDETATQNQLLGRASLIAHETAHMWFGDLVTMKWFSDVWMKEVFANHMAAKIVNPAFPAINHDLRYLVDHFPAAYAVDRTEGTNEIRQPLANLNEAGTLYGAIIYQKAPIVMRQLETLVGSAAFRDGLRDYLRMYTFGNASWQDLIAILDERTPEDLAAWSRAWVEERGRPIITTELSVANGRIRRLAFTQRDPETKRGLTWTQQITVATGGKDTRLVPVQLKGRRTEVPAARGLPARFVLPNGGGVAYGEFHLDRASLTWLMANLPAIDDELTRGSAWITLWDAVLTRDVTASAFLDLAIAGLRVETNELNINRVLSYVREAYWRHTTPVARRTLARRLEPVLRHGLATAPTSSLKSVWFSALRDVALTPSTITWLTRVWKQEEKVAGLTLAELDFIRLAQDLAVRDGTNAAAILDQQYGQIKNPDRKLQFAFVRPAIAGDAREREAWFAALADVANRRREPWVLEGLRYLHHPLRAAASEKYLETSLLLVREIQRTGDIFFPKRWMDATLSGYQSASAAATVREFVDRLPPEYPERLRRIILSSADDLFRASAAPRAAKPQ